MEKVEQVAKNIFLKVASRNANLFLREQNWQVYQYGRSGIHESITLGN